MKNFILFAVSILLFSCVSTRSYSDLEVYNKINSELLIAKDSYNNLGIWKKNQSYEREYIEESGRLEIVDSLYVLLFKDIEGYHEVNDSILLLKKKNKYIKFNMNSVKSKKYSSLNDLKEALNMKNSISFRKVVKRDI